MLPEEGRKEISITEPDSWESGQKSPTTATDLRPCWQAAEKVAGLRPETGKTKKGSKIDFDYLFLFSGGRKDHKNNCFRV